MTRAQPPGDPPGLLVGVVAALAVGFAAQGALPLLVGAVMDGLGVSAAQVGLLGTVEIGAVALTSLVVAPRIHRISRRGLALIGTGLACSGQALSMFADSYDTLLLVRAFTGLGEGAAFAAANAAIARSAMPERLFATVALVAGVGAGMVLLVLPHVISPWGFSGGFAVLLGIGLVALPLLRWLPSEADGRSGARRPRPARPVLGIAAVLSLLILALGQSGLWAFTERIGLTIELSREMTGAVLAGSTVGGLSGAALAAFLGTRVGRTGPLVLGLAGIAISTGMIGGTESAVVYAAMLLLWWFSFLFVSPFLLGTAAALDREGRWATAAGGLSAIGSALGPASAGTLIAVYSYDALSWLVAGCACIALLLIVPVSLTISGSAER